jgi:hypothetical protein
MNLPTLLKAAPPGTRPFFGSQSRNVMAAVVGGGISVGIASYAKSHSTAPQPDGSSVGYLDRGEAKQYFSGPFAPTTILPLTIAFLAIGGLYTKGRILLPERGAAIPTALQDAAKAAGTVIIPGEGSKTKQLYALTGGMIFGSFGANQIVVGEDRFQDRHIPVDGNNEVIAGYGTTPAEQAAH